MKKLLSVILVLAMNLSILAIAVAAETLTYKREKRLMVVFGDSISTGYGLAGDIYTRESYANLVAQALEFAPGSEYVNYAVDGYTSEDILNAALRQTEVIKNADLILLTCGGNDILQHAINIAMSVSGSTSNNLMQIALAILMMEPNAVMKELQSESNEAIIREALDEYRANMKELVSHLRQNAPYARIVFLTQYNPLSGLPIGDMLDNYAENTIERLNTIMTEVVTAGNCEIVDTHAVMIGRGVLGNPWLIKECIDYFEGAFKKDAID